MRAAASTTSLRGRSGRQGDPGSSRFYVSFEDELMRLFGPERLDFFLGKWPENEPIEHEAHHAR